MRKDKKITYSKGQESGLDVLDSDLLGKLVETLDLVSAVSFFKTCKTVHDNQDLRGIVEKKGCIREVFCGFRHTMLLCESGELYVCGSNFRGQLGLGHRGDRIIFTRVEGLPAGERIKQLVCGDNHTMLLCESGELYACGRNGDGQLGLGHRQDRDIFTRVKGLPFGVRIKQLVCGWIHTMLLCESGALYACGDNCGGQLGLGDEKGFTTFTRVEGLPAGVHIKQLVCGWSRTMLLYESGALYACGSNRFGQLGLGDEKDRFTFTRVEGLPAGERIKQLVCGEYHTTLLCESGELYVCGNNYYGQLGLVDEKDRTIFTRVAGLPVRMRIKQLVCGSEHTVLLCESGELYACGNNYYGQLGLVDEKDRTIFTRVARLPVGMRIKQLVCGGWCPMLLYESGALYACGSNRDGQLGLGDKENRTTFTRVGSGLPKWYWANISRNNETPSMSIS